MDIHTIETKWNEKWIKDKIFESEIDSKKEKRFVTAAFPYPNSPQHIGHARTYTTADIYARYLRLLGHNVLFPMGFHVTGTPIIAMAKRISAKEKDVIEVFDKIYGISPQKASELTEPKALVSYFSKEIEQGMREMGYSIDWRRKFYSFDPRFNKFIEWQFRKLKVLGYLVKGEYPIAWCPADNQAVSAHDTKGDVDPEIENVTVVKFAITKHDVPVYLVATTYRPETIYGVTNIWINPKVMYVTARYKGDIIILSEDSANLLKLQLGLEIIQKIKGEDLPKHCESFDMGHKNPINPITKEGVPIYMASFVKSDVGTGIVMSVPAHAPLDYLALRDLGKEKMQMPQVVSLKGYGPAPAKDIVEKMKVKNQNDPIAEEATKEIYSKEAHEGIMMVGEFKGQKALVAKEKIAAKLKENSDAFEIVTIGNGPVHCRCGTKVIVNLLRDQWFIDYGISEWKNKAHECLDHLSIIPEKNRQEYNYTIDWLKRRPTARAAGLGTRFPFDETKMIEALSDSTLYMAFYTFVHLLDDFKAEELTEQLFDYILLNKIVLGGKINPKVKKLKESFEYWYPVDSRHSAGDLIRNHLTLYIFNHVALLEKKFWPKQIVTNGFVLMDGTKMSKSMGNILPLRKAIKEYGADVIRFSVVAGAELSSDSDFNKSVAEGVSSRLTLVSKIADETILRQFAKGAEGKLNSRINKWLLSRLNKRIVNSQKMYERFELRELALEIFYGAVSDLEWYLKRTNNQEYDLSEFFVKWLPVISPLMPHFAEEYWEKFHGKGTLSKEGRFPKVNEKEIDEKLERGEELIKNIVNDVEKISKLINKKAEKVTVFVAADWKRKIYEIAQKEKTFDGILKTAAKDKTIPMKDAPKVVQGIMKNIHSLSMPLSSEEEHSALVDGIAFIESELKCKVQIEKEGDSRQEKAKNAMPNKPAILVE